MIVRMIMGRHGNEAAPARGWSGRGEAGTSRQVASANESARVGLQLYIIV